MLCHPNDHFIMLVLSLADNLCFLKRVKIVKCELGQDEYGSFWSNTLKISWGSTIKLVWKKEQNILKISKTITSLFERKKFNDKETSFVMLTFLVNLTLISILVLPKNKKRSHKNVKTWSNILFGQDKVIKDYRKNQTGINK